MVLNLECASNLIGVKDSLFKYLVLLLVAARLLWWSNAAAWTNRTTASALIISCFFNLADASCVYMIYDLPGIPNHVVLLF
ncbi:unnamed protein product [Coffea canephora]|uniref:Uncharacterized protein n=1 Tax=Coffea canephora TaxID=49390 RepID=A0A068VCU6_COFCA|nr:unnamed protein product [Coffea canephora]